MKTKVVPVYTGGGIMMGYEAKNSEAVLLTTNFVAYGSNVNFMDNSRCRRCGKCTRNCPAGLDVHKIVRALEKNKNANVSMFHPELCIQCGTCTYHCMAGKNTMEIIIMSKEKLFLVKE